MKKSIWTSALAMLLVIATMLTLVACGKEEQKEEEQTKETTSVSAYKSKGEYQTLADPVSWEDINAIPIKKTGMSIDELKSICVDFFRYSKTAVWIPDAKYEVVKEDKVQRTMEEGKVYGGLPYVGLASGNIYRLMDYIDPETGVGDITAAGENPKLFGNQCSIGAYWGWARVINSADYNWTERMTHANGFPRIGPYTYSDQLINYKDCSTRKICRDNGTETMYESYAELKKGDGIVYYTTAGHVVMITEDAHVERKADGTIDPRNSYVMVLDQATVWMDAINAAGDKYTHESTVDGKWTFGKLFTENYLPFTYAEWLGTDPIEETEYSFSISGDSVKVSDLQEGKATCNYGLCDMYAIVKDSKGNEVYKLASRATSAGMKSLSFSGTTTSWGSLEELDKKKDYTVEVVLQIGTGERPTIWSGKLVLE